MKKSLYVLFTLVFLLSACNKNSDNNDNNEKVITLTKEQVSEWVYTYMDYLYYWEDYMPTGVNPLDEKDPEEFFYELLYEEEDKWSFITDDYTSFEAELSGVPESMGYSPAFGRFSSSDKVFIVIEYVYPDSPASEAGLERGDIILTIDGSPMDTTQYIEQYSKSSYVAGLGEYDGESIFSTGESVSLFSRVISTDPVLSHKVIENEGIKTGYLAYAEFMSGSSDQFVNSLDLALEDFTSQAIDELVVDLRYNPGGEISMAGYLASSIAPLSTVTGKKTLVRFLYNSNLTDYYEEVYGKYSDAFYYRFPESSCNLNLDRVFFLTTGGTASASELLISGLDPFMDVTIIGENTYGKYTGAIVLPDTETPARHNWAIIPIILKYANSVGVTDFKDGLEADYLVYDDLLNAKPLGDENDPHLEKALSIIYGSSTSKKSALMSKPFIDLQKPKENIKTSLYIDSDFIETLSDYK